MSDRQQDQVLGHSDEADGIEEYDNRLPAWWLGILYFTIVFSVIYSVHYHWVGGRSQVGEYDHEVALATQRWPVQDAVAATATADPAAGKAVFDANCVGCHGAELTGGIGPNLIDAEWIHGGSSEEIAKTVSEGVLDKGMPGWKQILGPEKVAQVSAYVYAQSHQSAL